MSKLQHKPFWEKQPISAFVRPKSAFGGGGLGEVPKFFSMEIFIFSLLRNPCKISKLYHKPFWEIQPILSFVHPKSAFKGGQGGPQIFSSSLESSYFCFMMLPGTRYSEVILQTRETVIGRQRAIILFCRPMRDGLGMTQTEGESDHRLSCPNKELFA